MEQAEESRKVYLVAIEKKHEEFFNKVSDLIWEASIDCKNMIMLTGDLFNEFNTLIEVVLVQKYKYNITNNINISNRLGIPKNITIRW